MRSSCLLAGLLACALSNPTAAQRRAEFAVGPEYWADKVDAGIWSWAQWAVDPVVTLRVVASSALWNRAARISPAAAFYLAVFQETDDATVTPFSINPGESLSCGRRLATPAAVLQKLEGVLDEDDDEVLPLLRENELYRVMLRTDTAARPPSRLEFETEWFMVPHPLKRVGELIVELEPVPLHWVPVSLTDNEAPVMRVHRVSGWQVPPPG